MEAQEGTPFRVVDYDIRSPSWSDDLVVPFLVVLVTCLQGGSLTSNQYFATSDFCFVF